MSLFCWNCRELGNLQTVQEFGDLIRAQNPVDMSIAATWLTKVRLKLFLKNLDFGPTHVVTKATQGGGLVLLWKHSVNIWVVSSLLNYIDALVDEGKDDVWRFTNFYGALETQNHLTSWDILRHLNLRFQPPWLCARGFNEILKSHKKRGGRPRPNRQMQEFCDVLDQCSFMDLGFVGNKFT